MQWVKWEKVIASRDEGRLGIGSLFSFNRVMIFCWLWRFNHSRDLFWVRVIKSMYGSDGM